MPKTPFVVVAGINVLESEELGMNVAQVLSDQLRSFPIDFYFKASFDKANRSSIESFRGPGLKAGLTMLSNIRERFNLKILTDFHDPSQAEPVAEVVDFIQIPAFLCRQTDLLAAGVAAALKFDRKLNIKKGQFLAPWDCKNIIEKAGELERQHKASKSLKLHITERGTSFGYNDLVVDMSSFSVIHSFGVPTIFDATHAVQIPGAASGGKSTGGRRENVEILARSAVAAGAGGIFLEAHPNPSKAKCDGPSALEVEKVAPLVQQLLDIRDVIK